MTPRPAQDRATHESARCRLRLSPQRGRAATQLRQPERRTANWILIWLMCISGALVARSLGAAPATSGPVSSAVLGPDVEQLIPKLLQPWAIGGELAAGIRIAGVSIKPDAIVVQVQGPQQKAALVLRLRSAVPDATGHHTASFRDALEPDPPPAELTQALDNLRRAIERNDDGSVLAAAQPSLELAPAKTWPIDYPRDSIFQVPPGALLRLRAAQSLVLLGVGLLLWRRKKLWALMQTMTWGDRLVVIGCTALGVAMRSIGGSRVPGYNNNHGFNVIFGLLQRPTNQMQRPQGFGLDALHQLAFCILPRSEATIVGVHLACSTATIAAVWAAASVFWGRQVAGWACLVMALLSGPVYYAMTEVPHVPAALFLTVSLALAGLAVRTNDTALLIAAGLFGAFSAHFHPTLLVAPAVVGIHILSLAERRAVLRRPATWLAVLLVAAAILPSIQEASVTLGTDRGPAPNMLPTPARLLAALAVSNGFDEGGNRFLNAAFTPPLYGALALLGVLWGIWRRAHRTATAACFATALALTAVQLNTGQMDALRHQLTAQGFWAILAGVGCSAAVTTVQRWRPETASRLITLGLATLILASAALWTGPLGQQFTPQVERRVYGEGVAKLPDGCTIAVFDGQAPFVSLTHLPNYLSAGAGRRHLLGTFATPAEVLAQPEGCLVYYRPAGCWNAESLRHSVERPEPGQMLAICSRFEAGLRLEPFHVATVIDRPDAFRALTPDRSISFGFFRVLR